MRNFNNHQIAVIAYRLQYKVEQTKSFEAIKFFKLNVILL